MMTADEYCQVCSFLIKEQLEQAIVENNQEEVMKNTRNFWI